MTNSNVDTSFTDLTREDLIALILDYYDPELSQNKGTHVLVNSDAEEGNMYALDIRNDKYYVASFTWDYYNNNGTSLDYVESTREEFRQILYDDISTQSLNGLRTTYQVARKDINMKRKLDKVRNAFKEPTGFVHSKRLELIELIGKKADIPPSFKFISKISGIIDQQLIQKYSLNLDWEVWGGNELDSILILQVKDEAYTSLALKDEGKRCIFNSDLLNEEAFEAVLEHLDLLEEAPSE